MQKFLSIPVTGEQNQLVSCNNIKLIEQASTTTVTVTYGAGKVTTLTHGASSGGSDEREVSHVTHGSKSGHMTA